MKRMANLVVLTIAAIGCVLIGYTMDSKEDLFALITGCLVGLTFAFLLDAITGHIHKGGN